MNVLSPARLRAPLKRIGLRGSGEFAEISWDEALTIATDRLRRSRETDPNQLAFFTGRDQSRSARDCTGLPPFVECADG
jgi:anaerobic selenocysteine-containing dehydrogenase